MTRTIFGVVIFSNESGPIKRVECATAEQYFRELNIGADWADSEPRRKLSVHGQRAAAETANEGVLVEYLPLAPVGKGLGPV